jgi:hypothetical protein
MSVAFGIALDSEKWMQSLPENTPSQNLPLRGVWERLEQIAEEKGLTKLSHFLVEDEELYEEALEAASEFDEPKRAEYEQAIQENFKRIAGQPGWFSSADAGIAIRTMQGLIEHLRDNPALFSQYGDEAAAVILDELEGFVSFLGKVESRNIRFKFWME